MVQKAVDTEVAADQADHSRWLYKNVNHKPKGTVVQWVAETDAGDIKRVLVRYGVKVEEAEQRAAIEQYIRDPSAQSKQRTDGKKDDQQAQKMMKLLPVGFIWTITGRSAESTTLHFKPDPAFNPPTREARVFAGMEGDMVIHNQQHRIMSLHGRLVNDVTFGYGLFGRLNAGGTFSVERKEMQPGLWQITQTHVHMQGHMLLFKSISEVEDDLKSVFERLPDTLTLPQAEEMVMKKPE